MTGFLTIEDANTGNLNIINEFYCLDLSLLSDTSQNNKLYDFVHVKKSTIGNYNIYEFKIENSLWTGGFYVTDANDEYYERYNSRYEDGVLTIHCEKDVNIKLYLYLCSFCPEFNITCLTWVPESLDFLISDSDRVDYDVTLIGLDGSIVSGAYLEFVKYDGSKSGEYYDNHSHLMNVLIEDYMVLKNSSSDDSGNYIYLKKIKTKFNPELELDLSKIYLGTINTVEIITQGYGEIVEDGYVLFEGKAYDIVDGEFILDLTNYNKHHVDLTVNVFETSNMSSQMKVFSFNLDYKHITSKSDLVDGGVFIIGADFSLSSDIIFAHNTRIIGDGHCIDLNEHSIILSEGVNCRLENLVLDKGDNAIIQGRNTKLDLTNVTFRNCISSKYNNQGACILCDIDINSLDTLDDYITNLKDCSFIDNHNCIVHGGVLNISNCSYLNTDISYSDKHNVGFLYQVDGEATITSSTFDINYLSDQYCLNEESIGYAQAILKIGQTASINNYEHEDFINNRFKFNNECHVFCKYYYDKIEACVYTSPVNGKESESYCYSASGTNWVFKENVQVTRASSNRENTYNPLME